MNKRIRKKKEKLFPKIRNISLSVRKHILNCGRGFIDPSYYSLPKFKKYNIVCYTSMLGSEKCYKNNRVSREMCFESSHPGHRRIGKKYPSYVSFLRFHKKRYIYIKANKISMTLSYDDENNKQPWIDLIMDVNNIQIPREYIPLMVSVNQIIEMACSEIKYEEMKEFLIKFCVNDYIEYDDQKSTDSDNDEKDTNSDSGIDQKSTDSDNDEKIIDFTLESIPIDIDTYLANKDTIYRVSKIDENYIYLYNIINRTRRKISIDDLSTMDFVCCDCRSVFITKDHIYQNYNKIRKSLRFNKKCQKKISRYYRDVNKMMKKLSEIQTHIDNGTISSIKIYKDEIDEFICNLDIYKDFDAFFYLYIQTKNGIIRIISFYDIFENLIGRYDPLMRIRGW